MISLVSICLLAYKVIALESIISLGVFGHHPKFYKALTRFISSYIGGRVNEDWLRLVIVDLDNTLWSGVVGDDGITSVGWKENSDGHAHYVFQKFLKHLHSQGVLLAICSKNDLEVDAENSFSVHLSLYCS